MSCPKDDRISAVDFGGSERLELRGFLWGGKWHRVVRVLEEWCDTGEWWKGESEKRFYRLESDLSVFEVYYEPGSRAWRVYKVYD